MTLAGDTRESASDLANWIHTDGTRTPDGYCECFIPRLSPCGSPPCRLLSEDNSSRRLLPLTNVKSDVTSVCYLAPHRKLSGRPRRHGVGRFKMSENLFCVNFSHGCTLCDNCARDARGNEISSLCSKESYRSINRSLLMRLL